MALLIAVLVIGVGIGLAVTDNYRCRRISNVLVATLISFVLLFCVFGAIKSLGTTTENGIYEVE